MRIRQAGVADLPGIYRVERASFPFPWPAYALLFYLLSPDVLALVAEENGLRGFLIAVWEGEDLHIHDFAVAPGSRRQGVGRALLQEAIQRAKARKVRRIRLEVRAGNSGARAFYTAQGFKEVNTLPAYYEGGEDGILMVLDLSS